MARGQHLIPCPVCGGELHYGAWLLLDGTGLTQPMVDCAQRHAATTDPQEWDRLRIAALAREYRAALDLTDAALAERTRSSET